MAKKGHIQTKFFMLRFGVHCPTFKRVSKGGTASAIAAHGAAGDAGAFVANMINPAIKRALDREQMAARKKAYGDTGKPETVTYSFDGVYRLGLIENIDAIMLNAREAKAQLEKAWESLILNEDLYEKAVEEQKTRLGTMYNEKHIPSFENLSRKFWVELDVKPIHNVDDFKTLGVANAEIDRIAAETEERMSNAFCEAIDSLKKDIAKAIAGDGTSPGLLGVINKLDNKQSTKTHKTLLSNLQGIVQKIDAVDGFGDASLKAVVKRIEDDITSNSIVQMKHNDKTRAEMKRAAQDVITTLESKPQSAEANELIDNMGGLNL